MNRLREKLDNIIFRAQFAVKNAISNFVEDEKGDTNFISIAIILIVVLVIAAAFVTFGKDLKQPLDDAIKGVTDALK